MIVYVTVRIAQVEEDANEQKIAETAAKAVKEKFIYNDVTVEDLEVIR